MGDRYVDAAVRLGGGCVERRRDEDERAAFRVRLLEREAEHSGRQRADVDVRLAVGPGGIGEGLLETVALVVEEGDVHRGADLLDVVGNAVAVRVGERRCLRARGDVMDDGSGGDVGLRLGCHVRERAAGRRPGDDHWSRCGR